MQAEGSTVEYQDGVSMSALTYHTRPGDWRELGAKSVEGGVNFCIFSRHATSVELLLYHRADSPEPFQVIPLEFLT